MSDEGTPFPAPFDGFVGGLTLVIAVAFLAIALYAARAALQPEAPPSVRFTAVGVGALLVAILVFAWAYSPSGYRIERGAVVIDRPAGSIRIPLGSISGISLVDGWLGVSMKTFPGGNSGLFGITGTFYNAKLGNFRMYGRRASGAVVLQTADGPIVVTPGDRDLFARTLQQAVAASGSG